MSNPYQEALGATLIERTFRERIVLVGVTIGGQLMMRPKKVLMNCHCSLIQQAQMKRPA